ncbi:hypothetical protein [Streptomyces sp. NPDC001401]|uniref:hypothetical protein n=1 Tax=Streptomyces sp. NPDC001401 TaxID=3364570 RepID=UPI0036B5AFA1
MARPDRKQLRSIGQATRRINLWHGSVRCGKTIASLLAFVIAVATAGPSGLIIICGRSLQTIERNCLEPLQDRALFGPLARHVLHSRGATTATMLGRTVHLIGAADARAEGRLRGLTVQLAYMDEATLLPEGFWTQLLARLSVPGARLYATPRWRQRGRTLQAKVEQVSSNHHQRSGGRAMLPSMSDLLTPIIAAVSALSGAALTGFISARSERRKEQALERQQQRQQEAEDRGQLRELKAEHMQWRRERRQAAYEGLVEATQAYERTALEYSFVSTSDDCEPGKRAQCFEDMEAALQALRQAAGKVRLEGPDEVAEAAHACESQAEATTNQMVHTSQLHQSGEVDEEALSHSDQLAFSRHETYADLCWEFVIRARKSLDEIMTPE